VGFESFTVMAILEARDAASEIFDKVDESLGKFSESAKSAADTAKGAGEAIDESLASTASGADALDLASAVASQEELAAAAEDVARAEHDAEVAAGELKDAQAGVATAAEAGNADALAVATERLAVAEREAAAAANQVAEAQARQDALVTSDDVAAAAGNLTKSEKAAAAASDELTAAQARQADVQKATEVAAAGGTEAVRAQAAAEKEAAAAAKENEAALGRVGAAAGITAIGLGIVAAVSIKAAGNFQSLTAHLVTDAGESAKNLQMIRAGILGISTATGTSATDITNAMYHIESAGIHGAAGLAVAKVAAEGAKVGGADLDTVSKTLVGTLNSYGMTSKNSAVQTQYATQMMNMLVATVGSGDMRMQDLASSLGSVTPLASAAGLSFAQVGGAVATMTSQNMTAQRATQDLNNLLRNIVKPAKTASTEMRYLGLSANQVSTSLKSQGLTGVMNEFTQAILKNTSGGMVSLGFYKQMTPATQALAQGILAGKVSTLDLTDAMKSMTPQQAQIITQFKAAAVSATGLKQTYTGALATLTGGATGLNTSLMLTGKNAGVFAGNVAKIAAEGRKAGTSVDNWSVIQGTFNQKVDVAKTSLENTGIAIGSALLPAVSALFSGIVKIVVPIATWTAKHKTLTEILFVGVTAVVATVGVLVLAGKAIKGVTGAVGEVSKAYKGAVQLLQKMGILSKSTADKQAADAKSAASAQESASAESAAAAESDAAETAAANEEAAGESADKYAWMARQEEASSAEGAAAAEEDAADVAAANDEAAVESSGSWLAAAGQQIASAAGWVVAQAGKVASVVASNMAGAATTAGAWLASAASGLAGAAMWVAGAIGKVAVVVASNVAGAAVTMAAWIAANAAMLLGITVVVAAVAAAVYLIVSHWSQIVAGVAKAWHDVYAFIVKIISDVVDFVRSHWMLIIAIFLGPLAIAAALIYKHFDQIKAFASKAVSDVIDFVKSHWRLIVSILGGPLGLAVALVTKYWGDIKHWFNEGVSTVESILRKLGTDVVSLGADVVRGIWNGISGMGGWLWNQVSGFATGMLHHLASAFGIGSPSKYTTEHGLMLATGVGQGVAAGTPQAIAKAKAMAMLVINATRALSAARGGTMRQAGSGLPEGLATGLASGSPKAIAQAQLLAERTIEATYALNKAKAGAMHQAGQGLVQGIGTGMLSAGSWLMGQVSSFASSVLSGISSAFGIGSPSRFTTVHGQMLGQGVANGLLSSIPRVLAAARKMTSSTLAVTAGMSGRAALSGEAGIGSPLAASAIGPAGGGAVTIVIDMHDNTVMSDSDMGKFAQKLGPVLARQLAQAGYKVRMA
jgi:TP901 family phage tail tape measure protein